MDTAAGLQMGGSSDVNDKYDASQTGGYVLDVEELQQQLTEEAAAWFAAAPLLEQGGVAGLQQKPNALTTIVNNGVEMAFWPISKPVQGILYVQRHWEELFWSSIDSAVQKRKRTNTKGRADTARKLMPGSFASQQYLISSPPMPGPSTASQLSPLSSSSGSPNKKDLAAFKALEKSRLKYSHLPLAHALNTRSHGRSNEESESTSRSDGTVSRLGISRSNLERLPTKEYRLSGYR